MTLVEGHRRPEDLELAASRHLAVDIAADTRDLFVLDAHDRGWTYREIGEALGVSGSGAHKMAQRARERDRIFREKLRRGGLGGEEEEDAYGEAEDDGR